MSGEKTLKGYFRQAMQASGYDWTPENDADIDNAVRRIIAEAVRQAQYEALQVLRRELSEDGIRLVHAMAQDKGVVDAAVAHAVGLQAQCALCRRKVELQHAVQYEDGYFCPACASEALSLEREALAAVPVSAIAYIMADIAPVDAGDVQKLHESRAAVIAWLEDLEAEEDATQDGAE